MGDLPPGDPPTLLDRVQVRGVRGEEAEGDLVPDVLVLGPCLTLDEANRLLVPRGIVEEDGQVWALAHLGDELTQRGDHRLVVEPPGLGDDELACGGDHIAAVRRILSPRRRLHLRAGALPHPLAADGGGDLEVHLVLENDRFTRLLQDFQFFLKALRSSSFPPSFDGKGWGRTSEKPRLWNSRWHWRTPRVTK